MDEAVQKDGEVDVAIVVDVGVEPVEEKDGRVVVDVKEGELAPFFAEDDEYGVPEVPHLGDVEEPQELGDGGVLGVIAVAREGAVAATVGDEESLNGHVRTQHDLRDVVDEFEGVGIHCLNVAFLHNSRPDGNESHVGDGDADGRLKVGEEPSLPKDKIAAKIDEMQIKMVRSLCAHECPRNPVSTGNSSVVDRRVWLRENATRKGKRLRFALHNRPPHLSMSADLGSRVSPLEDRIPNR